MRDLPDNSDWSYPWVAFLGAVFGSAAGYLLYLLEQDPLAWIAAMKWW